MRTFLLVAFCLSAVVAQPAPLRVSMISLGVNDMERSVKFYGDTLGLQILGKPAEVSMFKAGDVTLVLNLPAGRNAGSALVGSVEMIFPVESVKDAYALLTERGCKFLREPREVTPGIWAATFTDPDGHRLTVLGPR